MAIAKLKKFKISTTPDIGKVNTLRVGDIVMRQYFDSKNMLSTIMYVHETGSEKHIVDGVEKPSHFFIGSLLYGDEPKNGELLDFVRVTNLIEPDREGALYLTSSDEDSPFMDVVSGFVSEHSEFFPNKVGAGGYQAVDSNTIVSFSKYSKDRFRIGRFTHSGRENYVGMTHSATMSNSGVWLVSFKASSSKATAATMSIDTDMNTEIKLTSKPTTFFFPVTTLNIGEKVRKILFECKELTAKDDYFELSDFSITELKNIVSFGNATKLRAGKLNGINDEAFGKLNGYGIYSQNIYATKNANIAGTLIAGDKSGFGAGFYAGKIHKNALINSLAINFVGIAPTLSSSLSLFGEGNVFKLDGDCSILAQNKDWVTKNSNDEFCFSVYVMSKTAENTITISSSDGYSYSEQIDDINKWVRVHFNFNVIDNGKQLSFKLSGKGLEFTAPQLENGDEPTLYQPTDDKLNYTDEYGAWLSKGGIGGTIQNPLLKLNSDGSIESKGDGFKINKDGSGHLAGGALKFDNKRVSISFTDSNIGEGIDGAIKEVDDRLTSEVDRLETNFEIKEGQISSSVSKVENLHKDVVDKYGEIVTLGESVQQSETNVTQTAQEIAQKASEVEITYGKVTEETKKSQENAQLAQDKADLAKIEAENAKKSAGESSKSYLNAKEKAELAQEEADRAKEEADKAALVGADVTEYHTEIVQTAKEIKSTATQVATDAETAEASATKATAEATKSATNAANAKKDALSAKTQATNAQTKAEEATSKAEEALASAGESSESYLKAKTEAELAVKEAKKATEQAELSQTKADLATEEADRAKTEADKAANIQAEVVELNTDISQTAEKIETTATKVEKDATKASTEADRAAKKATEANTKALEATKKAEEALNSAGASSESYLNAKAEADKAVKEALTASEKAKQANQSALDAQKALANVTDKETNITQTAEKIESTAKKVEIDATKAGASAVKASQEADKASASSTLATEQAELAGTKATLAETKANEANKKAQEALESAGESSKSYLEAKAKAELAQQEATKAKAQATLAETKANLAKTEADRAKAEADAIKEINSDIVEMNTDIIQTAEKIASTATQVEKDAGIANEASKKAQSEASKANAEASKANNKALEATKRAEEALASAGASSQSYKNAQAEADKAVKEALTATEKAKQANKSALDAQNALANVTKKETAINQTAEQVTIKATETSNNAKKAEDSAKRAVDAEASINVKADGIVMEASQKAADKAIDGLEIGGRNLWTGTRFFSDKWIIGSNVEKVGIYKLGDVYSIKNGYATDNIVIENDFFENNDTYTISVFAKVSKKNTSDTASLGITIGGSNIAVQQKEVSTEWARLKWVIKAEEEAVTLQRFRFEAKGDNFIDICLPKLEKGNKATDWTPAPEDMATVKETKAEFKVMSDRIESNVKAIEKQGGTINSHQTQITQNAKNIESKASASSVDALTNRVTSSESKITQNANEIKGLVKKTDYDKNNQEVKNSISSISQQADKISLQVTEQGKKITGIDGRVKKTEIALEPDNIWLAVKNNTQKEIDGLEIGVRNLVLNSSSFTRGGEASGITKKDWNGFVGYSVEKTNSNWASFYLSMSPLFNEVNIDYVFSVDIYYIGDNPVAPAFYSRTTEYRKVVGDIEDGKWMRVYQVLKPTSLDKFNPHFGFSGRSGEFYFRNFKLEKGNKPTDWTPAPEDYSTTEEIVTSMKMTDKGISMIGKEIDMTGGITFSMMKDGAGNTLIQGGKVKTDKLNVVDIVAKGIRTNHIEGLTLNFTKGKIGGWNISPSAITKNNVSLGSDGTIQNGSKWLFKNDGSGGIASNNIKWDTNGNVTFSDKVKLNWQRAIDDLDTVNRNYAYINEYNYIFISNDFPRNNKQYLSLSLWGNFEGFTNVAPFGEIFFEGNYDSYFLDYKYIKKSDNHIVFEGGYVDLSLETDKDLTLGFGYQGLEELITKVKVDLGKKATDWTPAPEDPIEIDQLGGTIITNNKIKTSLLNATEIVTNGLTAEHITGKNLNFKQGTIGGWTIDASKLRGKNVLLEADGGIKNTTGLWELNNDGSVKFGKDGEISVKDRKVNVGGFTINGDYLEGEKQTKDSSSGKSGKSYVELAPELIATSFHSSDNVYNYSVSLGTGFPVVSGISPKLYVSTQSTADFGDNDIGIMIDMINTNNRPITTPIGIDINMRGAIDNSFKLMPNAIRIRGGVIDGMAEKITFANGNSHHLTEKDDIIVMESTSRGTLYLPLRPNNMPVGKIFKFVTIGNEADVYMSDKTSKNIHINKWDSYWGTRQHILVTIIYLGNGKYKMYRD